MASSRQHQHEPGKEQFPWTPEGQASRADFAEWLRQNQQREILAHVSALHETQQLLIQQNELARVTSTLVNVVLRLWGVKAPVERPAAEAPRDLHVPQIVAWRTYRGFREDMQAREQAIVDAAHELGRKPIVTKEALSDQRGGDSVKSISRCMRRYGLEPAWPPSSWPEEEPRGPVDSHTAALFAAGLFGWAMLDFVSDGKFDQTVRMVRFVGCHVGVPM